MPEAVAALQRTTYHHGNLRRALIDGALELLREGGVEALTLRAAARRAGVSPAAPYRHYEDKNALLAAVAKEGFDALAERMMVATEANKAFPVQAVSAQGEAYIRFAMEQPAHFRVMFGPEVADRTPYPELRAAGDRAFDAVVRAIVAAQATGLVRAGPPEALALLSWSSAHGLASLALTGQLDVAAGPGERGVDIALRVKELVYLGLRP
jgi:AcrR family transcriptional regulator